MLTITGLDEFQRELNGLARRIEALPTETTIPLPELLTPDFLSSCSAFHSAEELFAASRWTVVTPEDFAAIPDAEWDEFISTHTSFASWETMLSEAAKAWTVRQLGV